MKNDVKKQGCGVLVGRFQVPSLHEGHRHLIGSVLEQHQKVIIFLGTSPALLTRRNPLEFIARKQMLEAEYNNSLVIQAIPDQPDDHAWSEELDKRIREVEPLSPITLYGARDSFLACYHGRFPIVELNHKNIAASGTAMREMTSHKVIASRDFRAGVIYAAMRKYPVAYPTVDIAVLKNDDQTVLLGRKPHESKFRFPGGYVDTSDENFEAAARREISEEAGPIDLGEMRYMGSQKIDDWRYRSGPDGIITQLFACEWRGGEPVASDDICELKWFDLATLNAGQMVREHVCLLEMLKSRKLNPSFVCSLQLHKV